MLCRATISMFCTAKTSHAQYSHRRAHKQNRWSSANCLICVIFPFRHMVITVGKVTGQIIMAAPILQMSQAVVFTCNKKVD